MKNIEKIALIVTFATLCTLGIVELLGTGEASAKIITATSCSQANVSSAINSATAGDTVMVPAGNCSWSGGISISGIQLIGAGKSASGTVITGGQVNMTKHASQYTRLSGFRFTGTDQHVNVGGSPSSKPYIIDNNYFFTSGGKLMYITVNGGVLHHNDFTASSGTNADIFNIITSENWSQATTFGTADTTGERNIYFEDNTFTNLLETAPDGDAGGRFVIRHNTYVDSSIVFHGGAPNDSSPNGGTRQFEVYDNTFRRVSNSVPMNKWIWVRGSSGVIANNTMDRVDSPDNSSYPNKSEVRLTLACPSAYPIQYQAGQSNQSPESTPSHPLLIFGNSGAGATDANAITVGSSDTAGGSCSSPGNYIKSGRDYMTNNSWGWTPYTYPHPLQSLGVPTAPPLDTTSPTVSITSPLTGATVSGAVTISANAADNVAVAGVQFILDGNNLLAEDTTVPYSVSWNTTTATNATHSLTAVARDTSNNTAVVSAVTVTVNNATAPPPPDTTSPTVSITSPAIGANIVGTVPINATAADNIGVVGVQFKVDGVNSGSEDVSTPYTTSWNSNSALNGSHSLTAVARDVANNTGTVIAVNVNVNNVAPPPPDTTSPTISITSPLAGAGLSGTVAVNANAADNIGVVGVQFKLDGVNLGAEDTASPYTTSWNTTTTTNGSHSLTAVARDLANNTAAVLAVVVNVTNAGSGPIAVGSRVSAIQNVAARNTPSTSGTILQIHTTGELGTVTSGPTVANGWTWWNINYDIGSDGWSTEAGYLSKVSSPAFNFSLSNGGNKSAVQGSPVTNSITATLSSGTTAPVSYSASGLPAGATATFSPVSCSPTCSSTLTIATSATTPVATSVITITGTSGSTVRTTAFNLSVSASAQGAITVGSRVTALQNVAARNTPSTSGTILQIHNSGELGTVIGGPTVANGWTWWNINYDIGSDGWSTEAGYLAKSGTGVPPTTPTVTISASPASVTSGSPSTLTWSSTNSTSCTASGSWTGTKAVSGTQSVSPTANSTYTLACTGAGGSGSQSTTVTVSTGGGPAALPQGNSGIASQYPADANIQSNANVLFSDNFESYTSASQLTTKWDNYYQGGNTRIATETGNVFAGTKSLEFTLPSSSAEVSNAVIKSISPTQDTLFVRVYTKFDPAYKITTGSNHNGIRISSKYPGPGTPPNGSDFFMAIVENAIFYSEADPGYSHVYIYNPEQRSQWGDVWYPDGKIIPFDQTPGNFGQYFVPRPNFIPQKDRWYSYEFMVKANTPGTRDGRIAYWIDGVLMADFQNVRVRDIASLKIDQIQLELHAQAGGSSRANKKWYDNLVVAKSYIGPMI